MVDLPLPLSPKMASVSPRSMVKETPPPPWGRGGGIAWTGPAPQSAYFQHLTFRFPTVISGGAFRQRSERHGHRP